MINLETSHFAAILGTEMLKRRIPDIVAVAFAAHRGPLSDEEAATEFTMLDPVEASVEDPLRTLLSKLTSTNKGLSQRVALIRWKDGTESLVGFNADDMLPPTRVLQSAYHHGFGVGQLKASLASDKEGCHHG
jgi:hypothetical protein